VTTDDARRVSETLGTGQHVDAPFGGVVKDVHASCRDEIERLRDGIEKYVTTISDCYCTPAMERDALELLKGVWRGE